MKITLTLPIIPVSYKRPRLSYSYFGRPHIHNEPKYLRYRKDLQILIRSELSKQKLILDEYFKKSIAVSAKFYFKSSKKNEVGTKHVYKPDLDNLMKALIDAGTDILFYDDDSIYKIECTKYYADNDQIELELTYED